MNARKRPDQKPAENQSLKGALMKSTVFHVAVVAATMISFPFLVKEPTIFTPVSVELVDISDVTRTDKVAPVKKPEEPKEIEAPKPPQENLKPPQNDPEPTPPKIPDPVPPPPEPKKEEPKPEPKPEPKKEEPKPKPKPPEPKKEEPKKEDPKKQQDDMSNLLKNLMPNEEPVSEDKPEEKTEDNSSSTGALAELGDKLTISELDAFKRQIEPCWNIQAGAAYAENLAVEVRVTMNRDGTVQDASVLDRGRYNRDNAFRAAADSALRALRNPRCSPLKLPPDKYNEWKVIIINFDPSDML